MMTAPSIGDIWRFDNGFYCYHLLVVDVIKVYINIVPIAEVTSIALEYGQISNGVIYYDAKAWKKVA